ncbi:hypothetical protein [Xylella fastidiosa]|uniref:hypothetical protein n=1 Tax=Xylella fastidiosa TaxID=2371 RepID=UPI001FC871ED|nr:hypothetical protein [Xylella fastidiosa]
MPDTPLAQVNRSLNVVESMAIQDALNVCVSIATLYPDQKRLGSDPSFTSRKNYRPYQRHQMERQKEKGRTSPKGRTTPDLEQPLEHHQAID